MHAGQIIEENSLGMRGRVKSLTANSTAATTSNMLRIARHGERGIVPRIGPSFLQEPGPLRSGECSCSFCDLAKKQLLRQAFAVASRG